ncbi:MAG: hypothetical protein ACTSPI_14360, partial [Candidatus Heimdallarchaeaceae archaeon]
MDVFKIKKEDTNPALSATLQYSDATAVDLNGGSVWFIMGNETDYSAYHSGLCVITGSDTGLCEYRWDGTNDTGSVGNYFGEFEISWVGSKMTLPNDHSLKIEIYEDYN